MAMAFCICSGETGFPCQLLLSVRERAGCSVVLTTSKTARVDHSGGDCDEENTVNGILRTVFGDNHVECGFAG